MNSDFYGNITKEALNKIDDIDYEENPSELLEYIQKICDTPFFYEAIKKRVIELGGSEEKILSFIKDQQIKHKIDNPISRQTLTNWFENAAPHGDEKSRENVYKLCFALEMDFDQVNTFFLKAYMEKPFELRNLNEAVFFFCFKNGLSYKESQDILNAITQKEGIIKPNSDFIYTSLMNSELSQITSTPDFINYCQENSSFFAHPGNRTAKIRIEELLNQCKKYIDEVNEENEQENDFHKDESDYTKIRHIKKENKDQKINIKGLINLIYKDDLRQYSFPKFRYIFMNLPNEMQINQILNDKASNDTIRKALILLEFFNFFSEKNNIELDDYDDDDLDSYRDDFINEINPLLEESGFVRLYPRNPYDWLFLYCASQFDPLEAFVDFIDNNKIPK